jgi:predicted nucleic acid-binding protein
MIAGKPIIYWDTSVFLAWIKNESRPNNEMDGVEDVAYKIHKDHVVLITSEITMTEILESTLDDIAKTRFDDLFKRRNCRRVAVDQRVGRLSHDIRNHYQQQKAVDGIATVTTPDAIHLATAILYDVTEFHTFDQNDKPNKSRALLPLNGNVAGHPLTICKPPIPKTFQMPLFQEETLQ